MVHQSFAVLQKVLVQIQLPQSRESQRLDGSDFVLVEVHVLQIGQCVSRSHKLRRSELVLTGVEEEQAVHARDALDVFEFVFVDEQVSHVRVVFQHPENPLDFFSRCIQVCEGEGGVVQCARDLSQAFFEDVS